MCFATNQGRACQLRYQLFSSMFLSFCYVTFSESFRTQFYTVNQLQPLAKKEKPKNADEFKNGWRNKKIKNKKEKKRKKEKKPWKIIVTFVESPFLQPQYTLHVYKYNQQHKKQS